MNGLVHAAVAGTVGTAPCLVPRRAPTRVEARALRILPCSRGKARERIYAERMSLASGGSDRGRRRGAVSGRAPEGIAVFPRAASCYFRTRTGGGGHHGAFLQALRRLSGGDLRAVGCRRGADLVRTGRRPVAAVSGSHGPARCGWQR